MNSTMKMGMDMLRDKEFINAVFIDADRKFMITNNGDIHNFKDIYHKIGLGLNVQYIDKIYIGTDTIIWSKWANDQLIFECQGNELHFTLNARDIRTYTFDSKRIAIVEEGGSVVQLNIGSTTRKEMTKSLPRGIEGIMLVEADILIKADDKVYSVGEHHCVGVRYPKTTLNLLTIHNHVVYAIGKAYGAIVNDKIHRLSSY